MAKGYHQAAMDNRANQLNPIHSSYWSSRGQTMPTSSLANLDNHSNQLNPNNEQYQKSRDNNAPSNTKEGKQDGQ